MSRFLSPLNVECVTDNSWLLIDALWYESDYLKADVIVPLMFLTDLSSVPRVPVIFLLWGDRAHYEAVLHDYLYRYDSIPIVSRYTADRVFLEAMEVRRKEFFIREPMYLGVRIGGESAYHKKRVIQ